jgi:hypothetical protein
MKPAWLVVTIALAGCSKKTDSWPRQRELYCRATDQLQAEADHELQNIEKGLATAKDSPDCAETLRAIYELDGTLRGYFSGTGTLVSTEPEGEHSVVRNGIFGDAAVRDLAGNRASAATCGDPSKVAPARTKVMADFTATLDLCVKAGWHKP